MIGVFHNLCGHLHRTRSKSFAREANVEMVVQLGDVIDGNNNDNDDDNDNNYYYYYHYYCLYYS